VTILGGFGLATFGTGLAIEFSENFGDPVFLLMGLATMGVSGSIALAAFPAFASVKNSIRDFNDPVALHKRFRKMRIAFGWAALGTAIGGAVLGILTPLTFGIAGIPAAFMAASAAIFGQVSLTFLVFEKKVETFVEAKDLPGRFGQGPQAPMHPQVVAASPLGLVFRF
jgi:MFS family permease